jgi:hypothetical protein
LFVALFFYPKKSEKQVYFLLIKAPKPPESSRSARQKQTNTKLVKSARNPPEIWSPQEIFFARQTTFKSARILQILPRNSLSGNAVVNSISALLRLRLRLRHLSVCCRPAAPVPQMRKAAAAVTLTTDAAVEATMAACQ